ncbi:cation-translocating P-type ATPase [Methanocella arvoryzae]|uniref:Cation-transporting P-type ATPase n=1 Tax=Methanocella arvoryzae (strain DSM 22066 / NBRC 105507 / MRE50) TaxID=351160 RepID=Q0W8Z8_METAR|nr:cation-transporting P-type ATPase [Methanocella arvoryzae]CAJ35128.1 cation-transporting P-type ATPase [Methanocella arvoryzae MRE50]
MSGWHDRPLDEVLTSMNTSQTGLTSREAAERLLRYGKNEISVDSGPGLPAIIAAQFSNYIVIIPVIASIIALAVGNFHDAVVIVIIVLLNTTIGVFQALQARRSINALKRLYRSEAHAMRDGKVGDVDTADLVPGDVIMIKAGDRLPADARIIASDGLSVDESMLTGESVPRSKQEMVLPENTPVTDRANMLYMGTNVLDGECAAVVVATGAQTEIGRISAMAGGAKKPKMPLERALDRLGRIFGISVVIVSAFVFLTGIIRAQPPLEMLLAAVSLAVATVPEGLAATITIALATGARRMANHKAIVRSLPIVEALGSTDVICTDKTGTLTKNESRVRTVYTFDRDREAYSIEHTDDPDLRMMFEVAGVCNDAIEEKWNQVTRYHGNQLDIALYDFLNRLGFDKAGYDRAYPRLSGIPFRPSIKMMIVVAGSHEAPRLYVKGAPLAVLEKCTKKLSSGRESTLREEDRERVRYANDRLSSRGMRVLAFAYRDLSQEDISDVWSLTHDLTFAGLTGFEDPIRDNVREAIQTCKDAGIDIVMITGDQELTAVAVAKELDLFHPGDEVMTGAELDLTPEDVLKAKADRVAVYARVVPEQKIRVVRALQSNGKVVAVTGDGVNDSPALKLADVGIAMGATGTEVAKEASDIVLQDDNFSTIVEAIYGGRVIYDNIRKFVKYLFTSNVGEVATIMFGLLLGLPLPLLATQILWLNLITDGLPALALSVDAPERDIMRRPPRRTGEPIINRITIFDMALIGLIMSICSLSVFYTALGQGIEYARTMAFTTLVALHICNAFNCRSETRSVIRGLFSNRHLLAAVGISILLLLAMIYLPPLQAIFYTVPLSTGDWAVVLLIAPIAVVVLEIRKWVTRHVNLRGR